jgi:hypothetical protein
MGFSDVSAGMAGRVFLRERGEWTLKIEKD